MINALRNIGAEGISINGQRFVINSFFRKTADGIFLENSKLSSPYIIQTVGNSALIKESLLRKGGIIDQTEESGTEIKVSVEQKDNIILNAS